MQYLVSIGATKIKEKSFACLMGEIEDRLLKSSNGNLTAMPYGSSSLTLSYDVKNRIFVKKQSSVRSDPLAFVLRRMNARSRARSSVRRSTRST